MVVLFNFSEDLKPIQRKNSTSSKILPLVEQVVNKHQTGNDTSSEQALVSSINYINNTNILNDINLFEQAKNFGNEKNIIEEDEKILENNFTKEKKLREKKKGINSPSDEDVKQFFSEHNFPDIEAQKFYNYFSSNGWLVGGKTPMVDWKAAAQNWMLNFNKFNPAESQPNKTNHLMTTTDKDYSEPL
jgi:hypothetical protein